MLFQGSDSNTWVNRENEDVPARLCPKRRQRSPPSLPPAQHGASGSRRFTPAVAESSGRAGVRRSSQPAARHSPPRPPGAAVASACEWRDAGPMRALGRAPPTRAWGEPRPGPQRRASRRPRAGGERGWGGLSRSPPRGTRAGLSRRRVAPGPVVRRRSPLGGARAASEASRI
jgi:hypothetical protein